MLCSKFVSAGLAENKKESLNMKFAEFKEEAFDDELSPSIEIKLRGYFKVNSKFLSANSYF